MKKKLSSKRLSVRDTRLEFLSYWNVEKLGVRASLVSWAIFDTGSCIPQCPLRTIRVNQLAAWSLDPDLFTIGLLLPKAHIIQFDTIALFRYRCTHLNTLLFPHPLLELAAKLRLWIRRG